MHHLKPLQPQQPASTTTGGEQKPQHEYKSFEAPFPQPHEQRQINLLGDFPSATAEPCDTRQGEAPISTPCNTSIVNSDSIQHYMVHTKLLACAPRHLTHCLG